MDPGSLPVSEVWPAAIPVQIHLVEPEQHRDVLGMPLLLIGVLIDHSQLFHHRSAVGVVHIVSGCEIRQPVPPHLLYQGPGCLRSDAPMPKLMAQPIAQVVALVQVHLDVADGDVVLLEADRVLVSPLCPVDRLVLPFKELPRLLQRLQGGTTGGRYWPPRLQKWPVWPLRPPL